MLILSSVAIRRSRGDISVLPGVTSGQTTRATRLPRAKPPGVDVCGAGAAPPNEKKSPKEGGLTRTDPPGPRARRFPIVVACPPAEPRAAARRDHDLPYTLKPDDGLTVDADSIGYLSDHVDTGDRWVLNFGPQHPATHTTLRLVLELDGERVARCTPHIGYLHSGFEKLGEDLDYNQYVTIVSRMDYLSPIHNDITWHLAVEKLFGIDLTPRCKAVRTILNELARIQNHLLCVGARGPGPGGVHRVPVLLQPRARRSTTSWSTSPGSSFHPDYTRVGGAMQDFPDEEVFKRMVKDFIHRDLPQAITDTVKLIERNRIFIDRTAGDRHPVQRGGDRVVAVGPDGPGQRRAARPAEGRAVPVLRGQLGQRRRR